MTGEPCGSAIGRSGCDDPVMQAHWLKGVGHARGPLSARWIEEGRLGVRAAAGRAGSRSRSACRGDRRRGAIHVTAVAHPTRAGLLHARGGTILARTERPPLRSSDRSVLASDSTSRSGAADER
jgi:hypothetical protein